MNLYLYDGPVKIFDNYASYRWVGSTRAISDKKAKSNLAYQYKKEHNLTADAKVELPGKLTVNNDIAI